MSKLANHIALFCSPDNTGYLVKYIQGVHGLENPGKSLNWKNKTSGLESP
jgi:hypothetical protein